MKKFLLLLYDDLGEIKKLSPSEMEELVHAHMEWAERLAAAGHLMAGEGLQERSIRITGKASVVQDSTFLEAKEIIGGFYYLQAPDLDTVVELAKDCPTHRWGGITEIRPIEEYEQ